MKHGQFLLSAASLFLALIAVPNAVAGMQPSAIDRETLEAIRRVAANTTRAAAPGPVVKCGDTITTNFTLTNDLNCPNATGFVLNVIGSNITVNGNGRRIAAPKAIAGLFAKGANITLTGFTIGDIANGSGILAYETANITIQGNVLTKNREGIFLYADQGALVGAKISGNVSRLNTHFGIRVGYDAPGAVLWPQLQGNDLSDSGSFALMLKVGAFDLALGHGNRFLRSKNGIYITGGDFNLHNFSLVGDGIQGIGILADSVRSLRIDALDASSNIAQVPDSRIGLVLYRAESFSIRNFRVTGGDVGIKLSTESGAKSEGAILDSHFTNQKAAGISLSSEDNTSYGNLFFLRNTYTILDGAQRVLLNPGVQVGDNSVLVDIPVAFEGRGQRER